MTMTAASTVRERTFVFVDLAGFTALTEAHGDAHTMVTLARFRGVVDASLVPGDRLVKTIGDAAMLAFDTPERAAAALQRLFDAALADTALPLVRGGAHTGHAVNDNGDFWRGRRISRHASARTPPGDSSSRPSGVALAARDAGDVVTHVGSIALRNIAEPVDLYDIAVHPHSATAVDPVCAMRVPMRGASAIHLRQHDEDVWFCGLPCVAALRRCTHYFPLDVLR